MCVCGQKRRKNCGSIFRLTDRRPCQCFKLGIKKINWFYELFEGHKTCTVGRTEAEIYACVGLGNRGQDLMTDLILIIIV